MSPEQVGGKQELDHRSDIYSLGIVLYELCTHEVPFVGQTPVEIAIRHLQDVPKPPRTINAKIPATMEKVILTCLNKEPDSRYQSADDLRSALLTVAQESGVETLLRSPSETGARPVTEATGENGISSSITKAPAEIPAEPKVEEEPVEPIPTTQTKKVSSHRSLLLLVGALVLIGAAVVAVSLLLLRSPPYQPEDVQGRVETEGEVGSPGAGEAGDGPESPEPQLEVSETEADAHAGATGAVSIAANPGTEIYIDGKLAGTIPPVVRRHLSAGTHHIRYIIPGYDEFEETVEVLDGRDNVFSHQFPAYGALRIVCQPIASVSLDGRVVGDTPLTLKRIREGVHRLVLSREGYRTLEQTIDIRLGQVNAFQFTLARR
jgi:hypothetical protein